MLTCQRKQKVLYATAPGAETAPGAILKKGRFPNILIQALFRRFVKPFPFGSDLGQAEERGVFDPNWGLIYLGQFQPIVKEIRRFRNLYATKAADSLVGV